MPAQELPEFAPFPSAEVREILPRDDWETCLVSWTTLAQAYLTLSEAELHKTVAKDESCVEYLKAFMEEVARDGASVLGKTQAAKRVLQINLQLASRILEVPSSGLLSWEFLADLSKVYGKKRVEETVAAAARKQPFETSLSALKKTLVRNLDAGIKGDLKSIEADLTRVSFLIYTCPDAAAFLLAGSDFLDGLITCYRVMNPPLRNVIISTTYLCLIGLTEGPVPKFSMLSDQLYALKEAADTHKMGPLNANDSLVPELVTSTPLLKQTLKRAGDAEAATTGLKSRVSALEAHRKPGGGTAGPKKMLKRQDKGKGKAVALEDESVVAEMQMRKMSQISQVQDLFPDLGSGFVARLLDEYEGTEDVISHLLEDNLPHHLAEADRSEELSFDAANTKPSAPPELPTRRNVFDDDELDRLAFDTSKLHFGKQNPSKTADQMLADKSTAPAKSAIYSALAAFDSDDDERDDTYDADDVGGTVDATANEEADGVKADVEELLFRTYLDTPRVFDRDAFTRKENRREKLREETGMTDEMIEGWAIMLEKSPQLRRRLENRYTGFSGMQNELSSTKWREGEDSDSSSSRGGRGGGRGRGRGRGGGAAGEGESTEHARRRKEANKGARANHNRRDQRVKKMARGGFAG